MRDPLAFVGHSCEIDAADAVVLRPRWASRRMAAGLIQAHSLGHNYSVIAGWDAVIWVSELSVWAPEPKTACFHVLLSRRPRDHWEISADEDSEVVMMSGMMIVCEIMIRKQSVWYEGMW